MSRRAGRKGKTAADHAGKPLRETVCVIGRFEQVIRMVPRHEAERMISSRQARRVGRAAVQLPDRSAEPIVPARALSLSSYKGQPMTRREALGQSCGCVVQGRPDPECVLCAGRGSINIDAYTTAFRRIDERDAHLFRLAVSDNLSRNSSSLERMRDDLRLEVA